MNKLYLILSNVAAIICFFPLLILSISALAFCNADSINCYMISAWMLISAILLIVISGLSWTFYKPKTDILATWGTILAFIPLVGLATIYIYFIK